MKRSVLSTTTAIIAGLAVLAFSVALRVAAIVTEEVGIGDETNARGGSTASVSPGTTGGTDGGAFGGHAPGDRALSGVPGSSVPGSGVSDSGAATLPGALPSLPRGVAGAQAITGWSRRGAGADARWSITWNSDAVTAARILSWLVAEGTGVSYALTPTPDGGWTVEATIDATGTVLTTAGGRETTTGNADQLARLLERSSRGEPPVVEDTGATNLSFDAEPADSLRSIAGGGSGFVRIGGGHFSWLHRDEALYLEPVR
jgi:hypothetical protein